jgi:hypothetical protein
MTSVAWMRRSAIAVALLVVAACGSSPEVATTPAAARAVPPLVIDDGGAPVTPVSSVVAPPPDPDPPATTAPHRGASAGLNLHAQSAPAVPVDSMTAQGSGTPPLWPHGPAVDLGRPTTFPPVPNAERVIASLRPAFRRCFARVLDRDPNASGVVALEAKLGPGGEVVGVKATGATGLPAELVKCISAVLEASTFDAPPGGGATLTMPISLTRQADPPPQKR